MNAKAGITPCTKAEPGGINLMTAPWSFNQPVLLNKTRRNSSVLVWTLVSATSFATLWAFLAPLPETVAVKGKLQPASGVQEVEAPLGGVVKQVLVKEGQLVAEGDLLIRFDARKAQAQLETAQIKRDGLNNQLAINRALVGDLAPEDLSANQANYWSSGARNSCRAIPRMRRLLPAVRRAWTGYANRWPPPKPLPSATHFSKKWEPPAN